MTAGARARRKGVTGERELADKWIAGGWEVRGLEGSGDWLAFRHVEAWLDGHVCRPPLAVHVEGKRQERLRMAWIEQARAEAPPGVPPVVCWRPNRAEWLAMLPLADLLELIG